MVDVALTASFEWESPKTHRIQYSLIHNRAVLSIYSEDKVLCAGVNGCQMILFETDSTHPVTSE